MEKNHQGIQKNEERLSNMENKKKMEVVIERKDMDAVYKCRNFRVQDSENAIIQLNSQHFHDIDIVRKEDLKALRHQLLVKSIEVLGRNNVWTENVRIKVKVKGEISVIQSDAQLNNLKTVNLPPGNINILHRGGKLNLFISLIFFVCDYLITYRLYTFIFVYFLLHCRNYELVQTLDINAVYHEFESQYFSFECRVIGYLF